MLIIIHDPASLILVVLGRLISNHNYHHASFTQTKDLGLECPVIRHSLAHLGR